MAKLGITFAQSLFKDTLPGYASTLAIEPGFFYSVKGDVTDGLGDYSGFLAQFSFKFNVDDDFFPLRNSLTLGVKYVF
jgi:hypothetical protein